MLGVSRTSVRDALKQLTDTGYLEVRRGRNGGYFVLVELGADFGRACAPPARRALAGVRTDFRRAHAGRADDCPHGSRAAHGERHAGDGSRASGLSRRRGPRRVAACRLGAAPCDRRGDAQSDPGGDVGRPARQDHAQPRRRTLHRRGAAHRHRAAQQLVAAVVDGRGDDAAEIAARHFALSENLIRELVDRAEHDDGSGAPG